LPLFQRYLLRELLLNAAITFAVMSGIFLIGGALTILHKMEVLTLFTFLRGVGFFVATNLDKTLPMTVLIAVVMTYGRAAAENEINSMRAAGVHLYTAYAPALLFGVCSAAIVLVVNDRIAPGISASKREIIRAGLMDIIQTKIERGDNYLDLDDRSSVLWRTVTEDGYFLDLRYKKYKKSGDTSPRLSLEIFAERARFTFDSRHNVVLMEAWNLKNLYGGAVGAESVVEHVDNYAISAGDEVGEQKLSEHTLVDLQAAATRRYEGARRPRQYRTEFQKRIAGAFSCVLFVLLGVPLAIIFRHGNRMVAFMIAFMIAILGYYPLFLLGDVLSDEAKLPPALAVWLGSGILGALGLGLSFTVCRR